MSESAPTPRENSQARAAALMEALRPALRAHFMRRGAGVDAEDLVQEVFLKLQVGVQWSDVQNIERYIFRTANNVLVDYFRSERSASDKLTNFYNETALSDSLSPERHLLNKDALQSLVSALSDLAPRARAAFVFHRFEEMSYAEIAVRMKISTSAVEKLVSRAIKHLAARWGAML